MKASDKYNPIPQAGSLYVVSGEGEGEGTSELYCGKRTLRAVRSRLTKERCSGDRWAYLCDEDYVRIDETDEY